MNFVEKFTTRQQIRARIKALITFRRFSAYMLSQGLSAQPYVKIHRRLSV